MASVRRTPLRERPFPDYTPREEMLHSASHALGVLCVPVMMWLAVRDCTTPLAAACIIVYLTTVLITFLGSSIYHGLPKGMPKQVMRVVDHCDIFFTIAGTYTPITVIGICPVNPALGWSIFSIEWGLAVIGAVLNAIDLKKYSKFSMACYLGMGWCVIISLKATIEAMTLTGFLWIIAGGVAFTVGAATYLIGKRRRYMHFVFHVFVLIGILLQFVGVWQYLV